MRPHRLLPPAFLAVSLIVTFSAHAAAPIQFGPADSYTVSATPARMTSGDFNRDGWPDFVVADGASGNYTILMNDGAGGFTAADYTAGTNLRDVAVVNLAGDSIPDLVISDSTGKYVQVLTGAGDGTFTLASISLTSGPDGIAAGDFNGDGYPDVAVCLSGVLKVGVLLGTAGGGFGSLATYNSGPCMDLTVGLVNSDGYQDIVTANASANSISLLRGNGNGTFAATLTIGGVGSGVYDVALADLNHDGFLDVAAACYLNATVAIMLGNGAGGFSHSQTLSLGGRPNQVRVADLNQDGFLDLVTANSVTAPGLSLLQATGYNTFMAAAPFHADQKANGLAIADVNRDTGPDIATSHPGNNTVRVMTIVLDTDLDGMPNDYENLHPCLNPLAGDSAFDPDADSLKNIEEYTRGTDPCSADTDGDGLDDGYEVNTSHTNPFVADTDGDGLSDGYEVNTSHTNPLATDTDLDGLSDGYEVNISHTDPLLKDTDGDGLSDYYELNTSHTDPLLADTDGDGMPDGWEHTNGLDPLVDDAAADADGDGLDNLGEYLHGTDPQVADTDGDGLGDGYEVNTSLTDPLIADTDGDGLSDGYEVNTSLTNPLVTDTDGDGMGDGFEVAYQSCAGLDPLLPGNTSADADADGLKNLAEHDLGSNPCNPDTDIDGLPDAWELQYSSCGFNLISSESEAPAVKVGSDLRLTAEGNWSTYPSLVWTGSEYGVSWDDNREGNYENYFTRVSGAGVKIGADLRLTNDPAHGYHPDLVWTGSEYGVSWYDYRDGTYEIYFARLTAAGEKIGADLRVSSDAAESLAPSLVWTGSEYGLSWDDNHAGWEILFARVSAEGVKIGAEIQVTDGAHEKYNPSLAWTGSEYGLSWMGQDSTNNEIYFVRLAADGVKIGADLRVTFNEGLSQYPSLVWTGSEFGLGYDDTCDGPKEIYFVRLSPDGTKIGPELRVTRSLGWSGYPSLFWTGSEYGVDWYDERDGNAEIYFTRISAAGAKIGSDLRVTRSAGFSYYPALSGTGTEYGLAWEDNRDGNYEIYFARIAMQYTDRDGDGLRENEEFARGTDPCRADTDGDGLSDGEEALTYGTNPLAADSDGDGICDGDEVLICHTDPLSWDSDADRLPDKFEVDNAGNPGGGLDPLNALDGAADFDGDGNSNANEYWNGSDPWTVDPTPGVFENPGCYYWADGDGDGTPAPSDIIMLKLEIAGVPQAYRDILPHGIDTLDLDRDGYAAPSDLIALKLMIAGSERPGGYPSQAGSLEVVSVPSGSVSVGTTTHVTVSVHSVGGAVPFASGFGAMFTVVSGNALLLGGDGTADGQAAGNRYDFSMEAAAGAKANMVVLVTGPGAITIGAKIPGCGVYPNGRWNDEVVLNPGVVINGP